METSSCVRPDVLEFYIVYTQRCSGSGESGVCGKKVWGICNSHGMQLHFFFLQRQDIPSITVKDQGSISQKRKD